MQMGKAHLLVLKIPPGYGGVYRSVRLLIGCLVYLTLVEGVYNL
jgi:hypothetical protein